MPVLDHVRRLLLAVLLTTAMLWLATGPAHAIKLALNETGWRATWAPVRLTVESFAITCNLTLEGSFHSTSIAKVERALIGHVSRASASPCTGGRVSILGEMLPWHVQYGGFSGTLPNIASMKLRLVNVSLGLTFMEFTCLARTTAERPAVLIANRSEAGAITSLRWDETVGIPVGSGICAFFSGRVSGTSSSATGLGSTRAITLTLIGELPSLSPSPVEFGRVETEAVVARAMTIRAGSDPLEVRSIALRSGASFALLDPNRCAGARLAARAACVFKAIFAAPREAGRAFEDLISVATSGGTLEAVVRAST